MADPTNFNIYRWTDPGAPGVSYIGSYGTSSGIAISQILDACLVDGYGDKTPLGWTKPYEAGNYHVYKMGANSSERYLQYYAANAVVSNDYSVAYMNVYDNMTSASEGTGSITTADYFVRGSGIQMGGYSGSSYGASDHNVPWVLIGNSSGFYLWKCPYAPSSFHWGIGGIASYVPNYYTITSCMDILSYDGQKRTILITDGVNSSYPNALYITQSLNTYLFSPTWNSYHGVFISNARPFKPSPPTTAYQSINQKTPKAALVSDNVHHILDTGSSRYYAANNFQKNYPRSKIFVVTAQESGSINSADLVGEMPGIYRFQAETQMQAMMEDTTNMMFISTKGGATQYGSQGVLIRKDGNWYGDPHFL